MSTKTKQAEADAVQAREQLREAFGLKPGATVYCILRKRSASGMRRHISLLTVRDGRIADVSFFAARALRLKADRDSGGIVVSGCGMDMGFHLVYELGRALYPEGYGCTGEGCGSNDHSNGDRDYTPHQHRDGGYTFRSEWV